MKKVLAIIGSNRKLSNTEYFAKRILNKLSELSDNKISFEIISTGDVKIDFCKGCTNCFRNGLCPVDYKDDMRIIKEKILEADFIIFGSPVYAHNITGVMKNFLDRISYWTHLLRLGGKYGYAIGTTSTNGDIYAVDYLSDFLNYLGVNVIGKDNVFVDEPKELSNEEFMDKKTEEIASKILEILKLKEYKTNDILEVLFKINKEKYKHIPKIEGTEPNMFESYYWQSNNLVNKETFQEVIEDKCITKNINYREKCLI